MDIRHVDAEPTAEERAAIDALLGPPDSSWEGGERGSHRDAHTAVGGKLARDRRPLLVPALQALQQRIGWISEGGMGYVCRRLSVPPAEAWGVATFYALLATSPRPRRVLHVCDDIGCRSRGAHAIEHALEQACGKAIGAEPSAEAMTVDANGVAWMHSPCLGLCDQAPAALYTEAGEAPREVLLGRVTPESAVRALRDGRVPDDATATPDLPQRGDPSLVLLSRCGVVDPTSLEAYRSAGGFSALEKARERGAEWVIAEVTASRLVGRGGAAFPTGRKWDAVRTQPATPHYLVCNADESEPGTFKDRVLLAQDPFAIVEAMTIAGFATGCSKGYLYIRAEYPLATARMEHAITASRAAGLLGDFDIEVRRGAGAYICGEETALFESIEGKRGEPRSKPPFPVSAGLFGKPTVVNNVETLANVLPILQHGGAAYATVGTSGSTGTRLFCLSGAVARPGVYEVPFGLTLRDLLALAGGGVPRAVLLGGAAGTFVRGDELDIPLTLEGARAAGATLGSGVVMAFDSDADMRDMVLRVAGFFRDESCGQCVPCRVGTVRQQEALHRIAAGKTRGGIAGELALIEEVGVAMRDASICGLGQTAYSAVESAIKRLRMFEEATT
ncbi:MAG: NAD(P)H-dependent oxidoreductase subunit E [Gemmatimonadaceae bacterium]|nr:NAD(P)H-dependent oxidoreductase subunit E [Gemmatimonadaceae bacterium]